MLSMGHFNWKYYIDFLFSILEIKNSLKENIKNIYVLIYCLTDLWDSMILNFGLTNACYNNSLRTAVMKIRWDIGEFQSLENEWIVFDVNYGICHHSLRVKLYHLKIESCSSSALNTLTYEHILKEFFIKGVPLVLQFKTIINNQANQWRCI